MAGIITEYSHLFTATNLECKKLLQSDKLKNIVIDSMKYLVKEKGEISSYLECSKLINNLKIIGLQSLVPKAIGSI